MSNLKRWYTKEDVIKDLAIVNGTSSAELDEDCIVVGERPPPNRTEISDAEIESRLLVGAYGDGPKDSTLEPDLNGITKMLRMVEEYHDTPSYGVDITSQKEPPKKSIITISKLNPNVKEFVPRSAASSTTTETKPDTGNQVTVTNGPKLASNKSNERIDMTQLEPHEIKDLTEKLKNKIKDASKVNTLHNKKEKNLAIATLLKLYTTPSKITSIKPEENTPKLCTPQYFESSLRSAEEKNGECDKPPALKEHVSNTDFESEGSLQNDKSKDDENLSATENETVDDAAIEESVNKVQNWLNPKSPERPKSNGSPICLGPITFKRKATSGIKSPNSDVEKSTKAPKASYHSTCYVPSKHANELYNKFVEKSKALEDQNADIWTRLQNKLKARDEEIRNKLKNESKNDNNSSC